MEREAMTNPKPLPPILPCPMRWCDCQPCLCDPDVEGCYRVKCFPSSAIDGDEHYVYGPKRATKRGAIRAWNKDCMRPTPTIGARSSGVTRSDSASFVWRRLPIIKYTLVGRKNAKTKTGKRKT